MKNLFHCGLSPEKTVAQLDLDNLRAQFPAPRGDAVFLDNADGSQVAKPVADRITEGRMAPATPLNPDRPEEVVIGATAPQSFDRPAQSLARRREPDDEAFVTDFNHEANIGPRSTLATPTGSSGRRSRIATLSTKWTGSSSGLKACADRRQHENLLTSNKGIFR